MTRHAPTLFVGLGGSGIHVLRWVKTRILDGTPEDESDEPVAFLGIDFDARSNPQITGIRALSETEFHYYDPSSIATCVNNLDREVISSAGETPQGDARWEFPEIRDWYPDPEQRVIRYAQSEATGAAQWRPLGRVGFFLNDRAIYESLSMALAELDRRRAHSTMPGEQPSVVIASSISGGTGSSMLFDVAVAIRKIRRGVSVRAYLILPEVFEHIDFRDRIYPNAYATLWELANLKNQHVIFDARYPHIPPVTKADSPPPFQRIYLLGPWMGDRRPFAEPAEAYPHIGDLLRLSTTKEIRNAALTAEANASADGGAPLSSPASRDIFCTMSAMGIHLLSFSELADLCVRQILSELEPEGRRDLLEFLLGPKTPSLTRTPSEIERFTPSGTAAWIQNFASGKDAQFVLSPAYLSDKCDEFFQKETAYKRTWSRSDLQSLVDRLRNLIGAGSALSPDQSPQITNDLQSRFKSQFEAWLQEVRKENSSSPRAFEGFLMALLRRIDEPTERRKLTDVENLEGFDRWIQGTPTWGSLPQLLLRSRFITLSESVQEWLKIVPQDDLRDWQRQAITNAAREVVARALDGEQKRWSSVPALRELADQALAVKGSDRDSREEQLLLDGRNVNARTTIEKVLARQPEDRRTEILRSILSAFMTFYNEFERAGVGGRELVDRWIGRMRELFARDVARIDPGDDPHARSDRYALVSPEDLFSDDQIKLSLLRCATRVFHPGRVAARGAVRLARLLVPAGFRHRARFHERLRGWARAMLGASASSLPDETNSHEQRIVLVLEDLFHPAEDLSGIYDYYAQYAAQPDRVMFHVHRLWPSQFVPLITRPGSRGRVSCGNPGCEFDLRTEDRRAIFCPGCSRPIRNRCGNPHCMADDLGTRWDLEKVIASHTCPDCKSELRTYWWKCEQHGDVPIDKPTCPDCVREGLPDDMVSRRPDQLGRFACPKCLGRKAARPFTVTGDLARFLKDGVDQHDYVKAETELGQKLNRGAFCPDCGTQLVPFCPRRDPFTDHRHYLYRHRNGKQVDRWRCYLHIDQKFYTCSSCGFPVEESDIRCKRCGVDLQNCFWCTPALGLRVPKQRSGNGNATCPHCTLNPSFDPGQPGRADGDPKGVFCSNLYGCPAGGRLDIATFGRGTSFCPICHSRTLRPLLAETREVHIKDCPFCTRLFHRGGTTTNKPCSCGKHSLDAGGNGANPTETGEPSSTEQGKPVSDSDVDKASSPGCGCDHDLCPDTSGTDVNCCLCGFSYDMTRKLMHGGHGSGASSSGSEAENTRRAFLEIGNALRLYQDDEETFRSILQCLPGLHSRMDDYLTCFLEKIEREAVQRGAQRRIRRLRDLYRQQFGCRTNRYTTASECTE